MLTTNGSPKPFDVARGLIQQGQTQAARDLLLTVLESHPKDASALIWLTATTTDPDQQRSYLERALAIDPGNAIAKRGLLALARRGDFSGHLESSQPPPSIRPDASVSESASPAAESAQRRERESTHTQPLGTAPSVDRK